MLLAMSQLLKLTKDTSADAFIAFDNPALIYREKVKDIFGLKDPLVIAIINEKGIYNQKTMALINSLSIEISSLENVDPDRLKSLATEKSIRGTSDGMEVKLFFKNLPKTNEELKNIKSLIDDFPLYQGSLVSKSAKGTLIVVEMIDDLKAEKTYQLLMEITKKYSDNDHKIYVAGEGAISGYLGSYIDSDAKKLNPLAGLIITLILFLAYRTIRSAFLPNIVILATVGSSLGLMAYFGVPFFVVTNAMPVILIGIAVADSIHIFHQYYEEQKKYPSLDARAITVLTMNEMFRPITLTTFTTVAGFMGLSLSSLMPPFQFLGLYSAFGVFVAWLYSITILPAFLSLLPLDLKKAKNLEKSDDWFSELMEVVGKKVVKYPKIVIASFLVIVLVSAKLSLFLAVNEDRVETFDHSEPIYKADKVINKYFDGTNNLDIMIEAKNIEDLYKPEYLLKIEKFQNFIEGLDTVGGSTSLVDIIKQMNKSLNKNEQSYYRVPKSSDLVAQLFLIYSVSNNPTDFEDKVDFNYQKANIRVQLKNGLYTSNKKLIIIIQDYIDSHFNNKDIKAYISGRVNLNYHWIKDLGVSHFKSVLISFLLVGLMASFVFSSFVAGLFSLIPVLISVLIVYAVMGYFNIYLGIGTSMFASIAIGLGVDFAIHTIDQIIHLFSTHENDDFDEIILKFFPNTGRALFFNFLAISMGFGVLSISKVVPLFRFGVIVALSVSVSFIVSLVLLPALIKVIRPKFITSYKKNFKVSMKSLVTIMLFFCMSSNSNAIVQGKVISGLELVQRVNNIKEGQWVSRKLKMVMTDRGGRERIRKTITFRKYFKESKKTLIFYTSPSNIKKTSFLTFDYKDSAKEDDQWLYLPAMRKVRRISASDRGDYFLGTDFSYEEIKKEGKVEVNDFTFKNLGIVTLDGKKVYKIESFPKTKKLAKNLGHGKQISYMDPKINTFVKVETWDINGNELKIFEAKDIRYVDGILTRHILEIFNKKTKHKTTFIFSEVDYKKEVDDSVFTKSTLRRGVKQ
ncbi:MAG: Patched family protein [Candidatus Cloacimonadota bacterium]|nr:MAG: Patched family protein [Candidatus Cloacimonadota bacterium]